MTVGAYAAVGALGIFMDDFLLINARYTQQVSLLTSPGEAWRMMVEGYGASLWIFLAGLVVLAVLSLRALRRPTERRDPLRVHLLATAVVLLAGVAWSLRAFNGFPDAFIMLPPAALGIGGLAAELADRVSFRAALSATVAWAMVATGMGVAYAVTTRSDTLDDQRNSVEAVVDLLPPGARILSVEAPQPLVLAHERNPSRLQLFGNGLIDYVDETWPGGSDGYGRWIARRQPTLIALGNHGEVPDWLDPTLDGELPTRGYVDRLGLVRQERRAPETRRALRRVVADTYVPVAT